MEHIIQQIAVDLSKKIMEKIFSGGIHDIDQLSSDALAECKYAAKTIIETVVTEINKAFREDKTGRKAQGLVIKEKTRKRELYTQLGSLDLSRDYYFDKDNERYVYPMDEILGIERYERVGKTVGAKLVRYATEVSYAKSSEIVSGGKISRQTVRNKIMDMGDLERHPQITEKKCVRELHLYADEDHVHMQKPDKAKGKKNQIVPLVSVTEGTEKNGSRNKMIEPMHFVDVDFDSKRLWASVAGYIESKYDLEYLDKIYIHGDGGKWIRGGLSEFWQTEHVMDGYHFGKYLKSLSGRYPRSNIRKRLKKAIYEKDKAKADAILMSLSDPKDDKKRKEKLWKDRGYLNGNWDAIVNLLTMEIPGSCTEAQVSHVLSERFSRDPLGWSKEGLGVLSSQRVFLKNGGEITNNTFKRPEKSKSFSQYAEKIMEESIAGTFDWSVFEIEKPIFDPCSGTQIAIQKIRNGGNRLF